ncbi:glycosyltransferase [Methanolobus halotolerans]|uniref:Glycosyl transferase family A n=1 Tax=Methanolobus halotolerans TaxID=2052935 RepID=A0A4E0QU41_9EURY|nr:glycosyltransferase family 2 protein [Methanolobus halotolerans]TGC11565.1 glycosyl transferase family A [Methanolobus halotolerans]
MDMNGYILVTPCKNEEESLPKLAESIVGQEITPLLWVIVNDGSTDRTPEILRDLGSRYPWIQTITLSEKPRDLGVHVSHVYRTGFDAAIKHCEGNSIDYHYVASVDADIILDIDYFSCLIKEFEVDPKLGICSGQIGNIINGNIIWTNDKKNLPSGGARIWNRKCFEDTGGYLLTCSPDSVSNVKAKLKGWKTRNFATTKAVSTRPYSSAQGQWKGYRRLGSNNYFIGYSAIHVCLKGIKLLYSKNGYFKHGVGIAYVAGYFHDLILKKPRIDDQEVLDYYRKNRLKEILCSVFNRPKSSK